MVFCYRSPHQRGMGAAPLRSPHCLTAQGRFVSTSPKVIWSHLEAQDPLLSPNCRHWLRPQASQSSPPSPTLGLDVPLEERAEQGLAWSVMRSPQPSCSGSKSSAYPGGCTPARVGALGSSIRPWLQPPVSKGPQAAPCPHYTRSPVLHSRWQVCAAGVGGGGGVSAFQNDSVFTTAVTKRTPHHDPT